MTLPKTDASESSIASLTSQQQRALLAELLRERASAGSSAPTTPKRFELSAGQQGLWFAYCRDPLATPFNVFLPSRMRTRLDLTALHRAIDFLAERHESLRTTFSDEGGELRQTVHQLLRPEFKVVDVSHLRADEVHLRAYLSAEAQRPFNLQVGPLLRLAVFQLADDDFVVLATTHHIVVDFWSLILMLSELRQVYPGLVSGRAQQLKTASNNYAEFVAAQRALVDGPANGRLKEYWRQHLRDVPMTLDLVTDYERPQAFTGRAAIQSLVLSPELNARVFELASTVRTTPFTIIQAAIQVMLCQYTGQREFLIGSPFSGRSHRKFEETVGFFVNMLPLRADLRGQPSFNEVIERTNTTLLGALEFEGYPFSAIVRDINPPRDVSRSPLFQVSCTFEKAQLRSESGRAGFLFPDAQQVSNLGGLQEESFYVPQQTCHYDLEFIFEQTRRGLRGMICYCRDLFSEDSMQAMAENFVHLLQKLLSDPTCPVLENAAKAPECESKWNQGAPIAPTTVCALIEHAVAENQENAAMRMGSASWSYRQMMSRIAGHASALSENWGARATTTQPIVPVTGASSPESLMAILGVMFSGAAVVPIDSEQPAVSREELLEDTRATHFLNEPFGRFENTLSQTKKCDANDLAYIIYTSGSTGRPKGVMIEHRAICNTLRWRHVAVTLHPGDRVLMLLSHQFDAGLGIALATLTQGAELIWADAEARHDVQALVEQILRDRITVLPAIPSLLRLVVEHPKFTACRDLRMLWTGGEAMPRELPSLVKQRTTATLWNFYGPTETAVEAIAAQIDSHDPRCSVPLGKPIMGVQVFVIDDALRTVPDTVSGQLAIAGRGLARGYLNRPELTAERFIQLQLGSGRTVPAYLSGDRGRRLRNGQIEFLGRADYQVKLRGYRIELQEIEQQLLTHPLVAQAVVIVVDADTPSAQLVGYICLRQAVSDRTLVATQIRSDISTRLPAYKMPVQLVVLDDLPMTSSGKVDRKRLPRVVFEATQRTMVTASTPLEQYLAAAWCESLKVQQVSVDQNFFELGGSSLQAAMLTAKMTGELGVHVPTSLLFDLADISQVAQRLVHLYEVQIAERFGMSSVTAYVARRESKFSDKESEQPDSMHPLLAPLKWTGDQRPIFMVHPPGGIVMCYRELAAHVEPRQPLIAIRSRGLHGHEPLPNSIEEAARDYIGAIRSFQPTGPYRLGGWSLGGLFALEMATQLLASGVAVEQLLLLDTAIPDGAAQLVPSEELVSAGREYGVNLSLRELNDLHPDEQLPLLWQHAKSLGVLREETPPEVVMQVLQDLKSLFHHHMELATRYQVRPYAGEITLIRPREVPFEHPVSPDRGWRFVAQSVKVRYVSGHHHSMVQMPHVIELAAAIELVPNEQPIT